MKLGNVGRGECYEQRYEPRLPRVSYDTKERMFKVQSTMKGLLGRVGG